MNSNNSNSSSVDAFIRLHEAHGWQEVTDSLNFPTLSTLYHEFKCPCTATYNPNFNFTVRRTSYENYRQSTLSL